ncbi:MAG TPA: oxidoreductase [Syntrophus sp. (in: bacteria)]|nr:oxidoreductase [Syntrophus sp. (in: bacteria)]
MKIVIAGAGQLGSRHLQALRAVQFPLDIRVIDPTPTALNTAMDRWQAAPRSEAEHAVSFSSDPGPIDGPVDLAIIATNADQRRATVEALLCQGVVRTMILEKLLFTREEDFGAVAELFQRHRTQAWVNCNMRMMPFYGGIRAEIGRGPVHYRVSGSDFGLISGAIHYLDHLAYLTGCSNFQLHADRLEWPPIPCKRPGFSELTGSLEARFDDGSQMHITCYPGKGIPILLEIESPEYRCICRESESMAWISRQSGAWRWEETEAVVPFQSQLTTRLAEEILTRGTCPLPDYALSASIHLQFLNPLWKFIARQGEGKGQPFLFT